MTHFEANDDASHLRGLQDPPQHSLQPSDNDPDGREPRPFSQAELRRIVMELMG